MEKREAIERFAIKRPESVGVYGYGSGVFKQSNTDGSKPLTDVIFVVPDIRQWHQDNIALNYGDYSVIGRIHLSRKNIAKLKGRNHITYFSEIKDGEYTFKYGVIEVEDFKRGLNTWDNIFTAGRFHKPVMEIKSRDDIREAISYNKDCALMLACLFSEEVTTREEIYRNLCGLSYLGDARMAIAENPHKVENIVEGSFEKLSEMYPLDEDYILECNGNDVLISHDVLLSRIYELPERLLEFLQDMNTNFDDLDLLRINIYEFITSKNKVESRAQIMQGVKTNGIIRSIPYAFAKVKKRFSK
jgi:hypothetical protein